MHTSPEWTRILLWIGAAHSIFMALTLLTISRGNRLANRLFAGILVIFSIAIFLHTLSGTDFFLRNPHFSKIEPPLIFLLGPLFYFYVRALANSQFRLEKKHWVHLVPIFLCILYLMPYYVQSPEDKVRHIVEHRDFCVHCYVTYWLVMVQLLGYMIAITKTLTKFNQAIKESFSSLDKINLNWLRNLLISVFVTWLISVILQIVSPTYETANYVWLLVALQIYLMGYRGLRHSQVFDGKQSSAIFHKYEKSSLTEENAEKHLAKLKRLMSQEKPHLETDITLPALAKRLAIPTHHLSQIINDKINQNFFEFINCHRVEEAKTMIADPAYRSYNLAQIGFEAGFNSISSFNTAFKKYTDRTPSQYRKQQREACV